MNLYEFNKQYVHKRCRIRPGFYTKGVADIIDPNKAVLVMGCNTQRAGTGGQAVIRYSPCAFGIATKRRGGTDSDDYFKDNQPADAAWIMADINYLYEKNDPKSKTNSIFS